MVIYAADITSTSQDAVTKVTNGFQDLIGRTYTQLKLLGGVTYSEQQIASTANPDSGLFDAEAMTKLSAQAEEVLFLVIRKEALGEQVTVKTIVDSFTARPYGWDFASIEVLIASLVGTSKVTLTVDGNVLKGPELSLFARIDMDDPSKLEVYRRHLKKREQAERRILEALRQDQSAERGAAFLASALHDVRMTRHARLKISPGRRPTGLDRRCRRGRPKSWM